MEKVLGRIEKAEMGAIKDYPYLFGLKIDFTTNTGSISSGNAFTVNISPKCKWANNDRDAAMTVMVDNANKILKEAKVNYISELVGLPVEITLDNDIFQSFKFITEIM